MEAAKLSGLPESTLRYYESIGIIPPISRDASSKHRVYGEDDVNYVVAIACLNAMGMSLEDMHTYMKNRTQGAKAAAEQATLLLAQKQRLDDEAKYLHLRQRYVETKVAYWQAVERGDMAQESVLRVQAHKVAAELHLPRAIDSGS